MASPSTWPGLDSASRPHRRPIRAAVGEGGGRASTALKWAGPRQVRPFLMALQPALVGGRFLPLPPRPFRALIERHPRGGHAVFPQEARSMIALPHIWKKSLRPLVPALLVA